MRMRMRTTCMAVVLSAVMVLMSVALASCDGLEGDDGDASSTDTTTSAVTEPTIPPAAEEPTPEEPAPEEPAPAPSPTPTTLASTEEKLPNGNIRTMGYIRDVWVDASGRHMSIDYADMLTGAAADAAAIAAGEIPPGEHVPNDYFIQNTNPRLREWNISNSVVITTDTRWAPNDGFGATCSWADFLTFWGPGPLPDGDTQLHAVPWWIERDGDTVVKIEEQYIP